MDGLLGRTDGDCYRVASARNVHTGLEVKRGSNCLQGNQNEETLFVVGKLEAYGSR